VAEPILDLSTIVPTREFVRVDGHPYDLALTDDFGLEERRELNRAWARILELEQKESFVKTDDTEYKDLIRKLAGMLLPDCPRPQIRKLPRSSQEAIVLAFFGKLTDPRTKMSMRLQKEIAESIGKMSLPDSNDSTEATQEDGLNSQPAS
jgi:hypothetical protein